MTRQTPKFRPSKFTAIAIGGAFSLAAAGTVSAVTLSSYSSHGSAGTGAAGLSSQTAQAQQRAMARTMAAAAQKAAAQKAAAAKAAQQHTAHVAHQQHVTLLAERAAADRAAAQRAAAAKAAAAKAAAEKAAAQKAAAAKAAAAQQAASAPSGTPQQIAQQLLAADGMSDQYSCLDSLWQQESGWNVYAQNPSSGAYGIPQALPGSKMATAGPDWESNAETQIKWGLQYIKSTYGTPCAAWSHEESSGWY